MLKICFLGSSSVLSSVPSQILFDLCDLSSVSSKLRLPQSLQEAGEVGLCSVSDAVFSGVDGKKMAVVGGVESTH